MAISSPLSSLASAAKNTTKATIGLGRLLSRNIETKRNISTSTSIFRRRRVEIGKRSALRDKFLAPVLVTRQTGPRALALTSTSTSISDRLLGFIGYLSAGWILSNMPTWIALGKQFTSRIITAGRILSNYGDESLRVMDGITNVFRAALQNISSFDFTDSSYLVRSSLNDLKMEIDTLGVGLKEAFDVLLQPFKDIPELGTIQPDDPTQTPKPEPSPSGGGKQNRATRGTKEQRALLDAIAFAEGTTKSYGVVSGGAVNKKLEEGKLTVQEVINLGNSYGRPGSQHKWSGATGRYQFMPFTLSGLVARGKLKANELFTPARQDEAAIMLIERRGVSADMLRKQGMSVQIADLLAPEFASFPYSPTGKSYYNQSFKPLPSIQQAYQKSLGSTQPTSIPPVARTTPTQPSITGQRRLQKRDFLTKSLGKGVDFIQITSLVGDGRNHGGIDIAAPSGTYIALRVDCEVVATGVYGDYGLLIDVWVPSLGIQLRMAHLSSVLIKSGKIPAGTSFARVGSTGRSRGPHIHLEYDTKKGTRGGGAINDDPNYAAKLDQYVRLLLLTRNKNKGQFTPAPTPMASLVPGTPSIPLSSEDQVEMQTNTYLSGLLDGITQERQGRKIVIIDDRSSVVSQQIVSSSGGDDLQIQIPDSVLLNNFIKNKLLLDLNYL